MNNHLKRSIIVPIMAGLLLGRLGNPARAESLTSPALWGRAAYKLLGMGVISSSVKGKTQPRTATSAPAVPFDPNAADAWLTGQQLAGTPLVQSFNVSQPDQRVPTATQNFDNGFAETYDNAAFGMYALYSGNQGGAGRARDILSYYANQYQYQGGLPNKSNYEYTIYSGDLFWLGILAAQYQQKTGDNQFDGMMQNFDKYALNPQLNLNGAIKGGFDTSNVPYPWASTENNLDALSYLEMRYQMLVQRNGPGDAAGG